MTYHTTISSEAGDRPATELTKAVEVNRTMLDSEREISLWRLARRLYEEMERLDPTELDGWDSLSDESRNIWYFAVDGMLSEYEEVLRVIKIDLANHHMICGGANL